MRRNGTSSEEFSSEFRGFAQALEFAQQEGVDSWRHEILRDVFALVSTEDPKDMLVAIADAMETLSAWADVLDPVPPEV